MLDDRVIAIAGVGGGLGPLVAERLAAAGATVAGTDRDQARSTLSPPISAFRPSAGTGAASTSSTRTPPAPGARRWSSASGGSTVSSTWSAAGAAGSRCRRRRSRTGSCCTTSSSAPSSTRPAPSTTSSPPAPTAASSSSPRSRRRRRPTTNAAYAAAKAAAEAWTLALADGFEGSAATANILVVDAILTPRMREEEPDKQFPTFTPAEDIADGIAFLCSDAAKKMNGQRLPLTMG